MVEAVVATALSHACCIRVPDDSMQQAGLYTGTLIFLQEESSYREGQMVMIHLTTGRIVIRFIVSLSQHFITARAADPDCPTERYPRGEILQLARVAMASTPIV